MHHLQVGADLPSSIALATKRLTDLTAATLGILTLSPILLWIAAAVKLTSPGPIIFRQQRVGMNGRLFVIWKFRTMRVDTTGGSLTVGNDARVTAVGRILRKHKLDELPQLFNVLRGDMSLVGPRPEVPSLMEQYSEQQARTICSVRPGMTDFASILFREESELLNGADDPEAYYKRVIMPIKYRHYERYVREMSPWMDLKIIFATIALLATGRIPKALGIEGPIMEHALSET